MDEDKIFDVKSIPYYYDDEVTKVKNNTVRFTDDWDNRKWKKYNEATHLRTTNTMTNEKFTVPIRHKCVYGNIVIITTGEIY